jgi:1-acyl-sn-glycerol-3-phosphate acyltransferase
VLFWDMVLRTLIVIKYSLARKVINRMDSKIGEAMLRLARVYMGLRVIREDIDSSNLPHHFLILSNHQSFLDIPVIYTSFPSINPRFVAKKSLGKGVPLISSLLRVEQHALINRQKDFAWAMKAIVNLAKRARRGYCPVIFPEGTRSKTGELGKLHSGAVRMILSTSPMPVLTVVIDGGYKLSSLKELVKYGIAYDLRIKQLKLYPTPKNKKEVLLLLQETREKMDKQLRIWREEEQKKVPAGTEKE